MAEKKGFGARMGARLTRWESVLAMVFLIDLVEDKVLFPSQQIPPWGKICVKMAIIIGALGILLHFVNKRIDGSLMFSRSLSDRIVLPRFIFHAAILGAIFTGYHWLKIGRLPWA